MYTYTHMYKLFEMLNNKGKNSGNYFNCRLLLASSDYYREINYNLFSLNYPDNDRVAEGKSVAFPKAHKKIGYIAMHFILFHITG